MHTDDRRSFGEDEGPSHLKSLSACLFGSFTSVLRRYASLRITAGALLEREQSFV